MGSSSDWETMQRGRRDARPSSASPTRCAWSPRTARPTCCSNTPRAPRARARGADRGRRRRRAPAGHDGRQDQSAGARRAGAVASALGGLDSLLSIVQMPAGVPVATFAIGAAGATNAALFAAAILANRAPGRCSAHARGRSASTRRRGVARPDPRSARTAALMTVGIVGAGQLGRMLALAGYPLGLDFLFLDRSARCARRPGRAAAQRRVHRPQAAGARWRGRCEVLTFDWENVSVASLKALRRGTRRTRICPPLAALACGTGPGQPRNACSQRLGDSDHALARRSTSRAALMRALRRDRRARGAEDAPPGLRRQGAGAAARAGAGGARLGAARRRAAAVRGIRAVRLRGVDHRCARARAVRSSIYPLSATYTRGGILRLTLAPCGCAALAAHARRPVSTRVLEHFRYRRLLAIEFFVRARPPDRQRDGTARAQLRPLDHRGGA